MRVTCVLNFLFRFWRHDTCRDVAGEVFGSNPAFMARNTAWCFDLAKLLTSTPLNFNGSAEIQLHLRAANSPSLRAARLQAADVTIRAADENLLADIETIFNQPAAFNQ